MARVQSVVFGQNEGGYYRDRLELQKGKNKEWLLSSALKNYMTPFLLSLFLTQMLIEDKDIGMASCSSVWLY